MNIITLILYTNGVFLILKNPINKIKDKNPSSKSTRQMRTQVDTTQRKRLLESY
jgi:hypothetical protein